VSDIISEIVFGPFWLMLPGLRSKPNNFFRVQTRKFAKSFEPLNSSLALTELETLHSCTKPDTIQLFWNEPLDLVRMQKC